MIGMSSDNLLGVSSLKTQIFLYKISHWKQCIVEKSQYLLELGWGDVSKERWESDVVSRQSIITHFVQHMRTETKICAQKHVLFKTWFHSWTCNFIDDDIKQTAICEHTFDFNLSFWPALPFSSWWKINCSRFIGETCMPLCHSYAISIFYNYIMIIAAYTSI